MAYAALVSLLHTLDLHPNQQSKPLREKATILLEFLKNSSQKSRQTVEERIRDAAYEAEDIVESQILDQSDDSIIFPTDKFDSIIQEVERINNMSGKEDDLKSTNSFPALLSSPASSHETTLVGCNDDLIKIKNRLLGSQSSNFEVIPIVGMGGIGKTTLATTLYNDQVIQSHFPTRGWVAVTQTYSVRQILLGIFGSMNMLTDKIRQERSDDTLLEHLHRILLKSARYLIVLDDVWDTDAWDAIQRCFPRKDNGSRIILTSRLANIADYAGHCSPSHEMQFLSEEESWNLLCKRVSEGENCPHDLELIGRRIAKRCGGLPLAVLVIGGLLSKMRRTPGEWGILAENINSVSIPIDDDRCLEILSLSYNHLPQHLKACFLYMGAFREDDEIPASKLIKLWVAEGFLKEETSRNVEEVAEENLKELVERNLILVHNKKFNGKVKTCGIHDQLRNLCLKEAEKENFLCSLSGRRLQTSDRMRRVSCHSSKLIKGNINYPFSRSFLCNEFSDAIQHLVSSFRLLRVLDLFGGVFSTFPDEITQLIHLRYLSLHSKGVVPEVVDKLRSLQTLIVIRPISKEYGKPLYGSHFEIWKMPQLRHVKCYDLYFSNPPALHNQCSALLENLQALSWIRAWVCNKGVLQEIPNLRMLGLEFQSHSWEDEALCINYLFCLQQLETLKCRVNGLFYRQPPNFLGRLAFPTTLKKLTLIATHFSWEEMSIVGSLPNLQVLKLKVSACRGPIWKPREGEFLELKILLIQISDLEEWKAERANFPKLEHLILSYCTSLHGIPNGVGDIPTLQIIELDHCSTFAKISAKQIQQEQEEFGNNLQVLIYPQWDFQFS